MITGIIIITMLVFGTIFIYNLIKKLIEFIFVPLQKSETKATISSVTDGTEQEAEKENSEEQTLILKQPKFNADKIQEYQGEEVKQFEFRPQNWEQFIGQEEGKNKAKTIIKKAHRGIRSHFLVDGIKGHGKTTFVELLAKSLNAKLIERVGKQVDEDSLVDIINEINTSVEKYVVFFIDEMESMDWKVIKVLNPIIEQFKINNIKIKPFIFVGATINKHILITNNPDTLDRIPPSHHIKFARYTEKDIEKILRQYKEQLYSKENISDEILKIISNNTKFNPRTSIALLEDYIVEQDIGKVLKNCKIVKNGLNEIDIEILNKLNQSTRAMGANALAMSCKLSQKEYITEFEPFLVEYDYINRVPSRVITDKGKAFLKEVSCGKK